MASWLLARADVLCSDAICCCQMPESRNLGACSANGCSGSRDARDAALYFPSFKT